MQSLRIHVEVFIASQILGRDQGVFSTKDITKFIRQEFGDSRPGIRPYVNSVCVANVPLHHLLGYNYLWRTPLGALRLFNSKVDLPHSGREYCHIQPKLADLPEKYQYLFDESIHEKKSPLRNLAPFVKEPAQLADSQFQKLDKYSHRSSSSYSKRAEFMAIGELLRRGHNVYMTLVDDQQINCVIRQEKDEQLRYLDIQILASSKEADRPANFSSFKVHNPRENLCFIFYSEAVQTYWIIPSVELIKVANIYRNDITKGTFSIAFARPLKDQVILRPRFKKYENAFHLLDWNV